MKYSTVEFVGGPYNGQTATMPLPEEAFDDKDHLRVRGSEGEFYVYEFVGKQLYFVGVESPE